MGGLSIWHMIILLIIFVMLFGANRLPGLGKSLGQAIRGFKKGLSEDEIDVTSQSDPNQRLESSTAQDSAQKEKAKEEKS
jgi:sec-independent protein translocase protein TatA